jgi:hypothetical protein
VKDLRGNEDPVAPLRYDTFVPLGGTLLYFSGEEYNSRFLGYPALLAPTGGEWALFIEERGGLRDATFVTEWLPRPHLAVDGGDLVRKRVHKRGMDGEERIESVLPVYQFVEPLTAPPQAVGPLRGHSRSPMRLDELDQT